MKSRIFKVKKNETVKHTNKLGTILLFVLGLSITQFQCQNTLKINPNFSQVEFDKMADEVSNGKVLDISAKMFKMEKESYLILDCREENEYEISHIKNARRVGFDDFNSSQLEDISKDAKIVTYCLIGKRSEKIGEKLQDAGYTNVHNLHGSMLSWMNEGNPVIDSRGKQTVKIHGFKKELGFEKYSKVGEVVY
ncbi:MAG: rhodanese-like domain-containing protein [Saprospiraceae bacterium]|nr:rhodanese-like domain-containing protein [Saprospiraceae bacterium]MBK7524827.1 rhodanese-like domain-containing protein [Saprospiraceae bacterium]MBK8372603.1 rhodanese-like domain-containing protein [Saprospiraceae bacterium]MBK8549399.1 rhodanese-like domain-containing protein [Saprospiraceae bacterium]MBK8819785.1 rhodanese-like domain-containing protein [Saprospiraceae bacterium]